MPQGTTSMPEQSKNFGEPLGRGCEVDVAARRDRTRRLNDAMRYSGQGGCVLVAASIAALPAEQQTAILDAVAAFEAFDNDNDPYDEHDGALVDVDGRLILFRTDYFGIDLLSHSLDPADPAVTWRVLTIMMSEDA